MYLVYRIEDSYRLSEDPRSSRTYYDGKKNVYVALYADPDDAIAEANRRGQVEGRTYFIRKRMSYPIRLSAALACGQEYTPTPMEVADSQI